MKDFLIQIKDKMFEIYISDFEIRRQVERIAYDINKDFANKSPLILGVLNGSFMFLSDVAKQITVPCEINFIKVSSYSGTESTGKVTSLIGLNQDISGRHIILVEDIVDTGLTMYELIQELKKSNPASISVVTLLVKPDSLKCEVKLDYYGYTIPNDFVVGYGLDYDGYGRNLPQIYKLKQIN